MTGGRVARVGAILFGVLLLFLLFSYLLFPTERIDSIINQTLARQGVTLAPAVHKTMLPGLAWDKLLLSSEQGPLFASDRLQIRLHLLPLLTGRVVVGASASIGGGELDLRTGVTGKTALELSADGIPLAGIPFFKSVMGAKTMGGIFWSRGTLLRSVQGISGDVKLEIKQLEFSGIKLGDFPLPDAANMKAQGIVRVTNGRARVESFTLESDGLYMRLSGDLPVENIGGTPLSMKLEIMPKAELLEKQKLVFLMLTKFMVSPGVYNVPVSGTLLKPVIR